MLVARVFCRLMLSGSRLPGLAAPAVTGASFASTLGCADACAPARLDGSTAIGRADGAAQGTSDVAVPPATPTAPPETPTDAAVIEDFLDVEYVQLSVMRMARTPDP